MLLGADGLIAPLKFWKVQSIGNHFPLVQTLDCPDVNLSELAIKMCKHHFGVGGDGLLTMERNSDGVVLRMFNPDGTEDFCGNGIRCAAEWAIQQGWVSGEFTLIHGGKEIACKEVDGDISTVLGTASYDPKDVPTNIQGEIFDETVFAGRIDDVSVVLNGSALSTGSTHLILPTGSLPDDAGFRKISEQLELDSRFPERTSVIWSVREDEALRIRIWERGVGETLGCGTGSSAAAVDWMRRRGFGGKIEVKNPGGSVWVHAEAWNREITLSGKATVIFQGKWKDKSELDLTSVESKLGERV